MFELQDQPVYRLSRPPLVQAVAQVRYPLRARLQTLDGVAGLQDRLDTLFPYMSEQHVQQVSILMGPGGAAQADSQASRAWRFTDDAGWTLSLAADSATMLVGPTYGAFGNLSQRFRGILEALAVEAGVGRCDRLGLRYINVAEALEDPASTWRDWFRPELTGWSATNLIGGNTNVVTSLTQTQLVAKPAGSLSASPVDVQAIIRHGYIPPNTMVPGALPIQQAHAAFLLDMDLFIEAPQAFDVDVLTDQLNLLHDQIDRFFRWALAPAGEAYFGLEE